MWVGWVGPQGVMAVCGQGASLGGPGPPVWPLKELEASTRVMGRSEALDCGISRHHLILTLLSMCSCPCLSFLHSLTDPYWDSYTHAVEVPAIKNHPIWNLVMGHLCSGRTGTTLNCWAISAAFKLSLMTF